MKFGFGKDKSWLQSFPSVNVFETKHVGKMVKLPKFQKPKIPLSSKFSILFWAIVLLWQNGFVNLICIFDNQKCACS